MDFWYSQASNAYFNALTAVISLINGKVHFLNALTIFLLGIPLIKLGPAPSSEEKNRQSHFALRFDKEK